MDFYKKIKSDIHYLTAKEITQILGIYDTKFELNTNFVRKYFSCYLPDNVEEIYYSGRNLTKVYPFQDNEEYFNVFIKLIKEIFDSTYLAKGFWSSTIIVVNNKEYELQINLDEFRITYKIIYEKLLKKENLSDIL